ncbi:hypothetical protein G7Z17_g12097 [Cylindrodendrum hubeiense]|uniref:Uncharacterized protein n=1 Tax=Cylindrodendrum hubeiense TaxID=595255 RepID=A0A9P5GZP9_9HYPO|nr:hypothetical protein G7Z17_g12097 [Cylindrodendrum hubeiense]
MASSSKSGEEPEGSKRASDFHNSMLGMPGYADDTMFFVVRYVMSQKLRECDAEEFEKYSTELNILWSEAQPEAPEEDASRHERLQELKQQALEKIKDYPDLVRDFDRFTTNSQAVSKILGDMRPRK